MLAPQFATNSMNKAYVSIMRPDGEHCDGRDYGQDCPQMTRPWGFHLTREAHRYSLHDGPHTRALTVALRRRYIQKAVESL